jgi:uncharacterized protein Yka (UPF0111/DUF47 family)
MMHFRFFSRSKKFFEMFGEAARNVHQGAKALEQMLREFQGSADQWRAVEEYEHEGDKITHRIFQTLHQSNMTPTDREDIHKLAATLDDVLDLIEGAAFRMAMYRVNVLGVSSLPDVGRIQAPCIEINRLENEADEVSRAAIAALFTGEAAPLDVIKWKEIYETMETATDKGEDVANLLEEIVLKRS